MCTDIADFMHKTAAYTTLLDGWVSSSFMYSLQNSNKNKRRYGKLTALSELDSKFSRWCYQQVSNTAQVSKQWHGILHQNAGLYDPWGDYAFVDIDHDADDGDHKSASAADSENVA